MSNLQSRNGHYQGGSREKQMGQSSSCLSKRGIISSGTNLNDDNLKGLKVSLNIKGN